MAFHGHTLAVSRKPRVQDPGYSSAAFGIARSMYRAMDPNPVSAGQSLAPLNDAAPSQVPERFAELRARFDRDSAGANDENTWKSLRDAWAGRKSGVLAQVGRTWLKPAKPELKRAVGQALNELKAHVEAALESRRLVIEAAADQAALAREREDLSLPGVIRPLGTRHPLRQTFEEIERIFLSLGYSVVAGPEMETPYYNFEALNIPEHHPARDNMDTFYIVHTARRRGAAFCARTPRPCRCARWKDSNRPCASSFPARFIAATTPTRRTALFFTRSKAWPSIPTSHFAISPAPSNISCANFSAPK